MKVIRSEEFVVESRLYQNSALFLIGSQARAVKEKPLMCRLARSAWPTMRLATSVLGFSSSLSWKQNWAACSRKSRAVLQGRS